MRVTKPLYIFDLDGTLALTEHRQHLVQKAHPNWDAFFEACDQDEPNIPVITTLQMIAQSEYGPDVWIWSGRSDAVRAKTMKWLTDHYVFYVTNVRMREEGDHTPDDALKARWYDELSDGDKQRLVAIFDDRQKVVDMWREMGVACFQVAPGDF